jgi:hypothetical protein
VVIECRENEIGQIDHEEVAGTRARPRESATLHQATIRQHDREEGRPHQISVPAMFLDWVKTIEGRSRIEGETTGHIEAALSAIMY